MPRKQPRAQRMISLWFLVAVTVALLVVANAHLIYVATKSRPDCLTHLKQGEGDATRGLFSAADSSCSPPTATNAGHS